MMMELILYAKNVIIVAKLVKFIKYIDKLITIYLKGDKNASGYLSCLSCPPASSNRVDGVTLNNVSPSECPCMSTFTDIPK
jgi:hypothetical protein